MTEETVKSIRDNPLFDGISDQDIKLMMQCLGAEEREYRKNEAIWLSGAKIQEAGIVVKGRVKIIKESADGNAVLIAEAVRGEMFGETFMCAELSKSPVSVIAAEDCVIIFINHSKIIRACPRSCTFHAQLTENMLRILALKNLILNAKIDIISKRSLREKILCYLYYQSKGKKKFTISLNREEMADYICADRSAVSAKLSQMQKDGIIKYKKNRFEIII